MPQLPENLIHLLHEYPVLAMQPVQWGELDLAYHVNNTVHARWSETGRIAYYLEFEPETFTQSTPAQGPILAKLKIKYIAPVFFPDRIWIGTRVVDIEEDRFSMETLLVSEQRVQVCALARATMVNYDYQQLAKCPMPADFAERVQRFEKAQLAQRQ